MKRTTCFEVLGSGVPTLDGASQGIEKILARYGTHPAVTAASAPADAPRWNGEYFQLHRARAFQSVGLERQNQLLRQQERRILEEVRGIEVAGMHFAAKMSAWAPTIEQRELYSFIAGDEARHYRLVQQLLPAGAPDDIAQKSFLRFIGELIDTQDPTVLVFFIQVFLEGWGIHYYSGLARACLDPRTKQTLETIVRDEASHHGSGLLLFDENQLGAPETRLVLDTMKYFLDAIRIGPQAITEAVACAIGGMSEGEVEKFLQEIDFQKKVAADLGHIRSILQKSNSHRLLAAFEAAGAFDLPTARECAKKMTTTFSA
jgi:rubrerythrin